MRDLVFLIHQIEDEIIGAEDYGKQAMRWKQAGTEHWRNMQTIAMEELGHASKLSAMAEQCAKQTQAKTELWAIEAERLMPWSAKVKMFLENN